ncbi:hypothetical protein E2C01_028712 [Portunus trituberculatus]|uniref:Uncharacterized protein n=1 Tax=Portunus trituberculatus TaxID=210409 RepID=A0A5B7EM89_PORTR|nr:hypothetical protein [Portunus trituberculatus]
MPTLFQRARSTRIAQHHPHNREPKSCPGPHHFCRCLWRGEKRLRSNTTEFVELCTLKYSEVPNCCTGGGSST